MTDSQMFNDGQTHALKLAKKCWHECMANDDGEAYIAIAMIARAIAGMNAMDDLLACRVAVRLLMKHMETLIEVSIEDAKDNEAPEENVATLREMLAKAVQSRVEASGIRSPAPVERPRPTLVPEPANR